MVIGHNEIVTSRGFRLKLEPHDQFISKELFNTGTWEEPVAKCIEAYLKPEWTFLDLGAATGYFSVLAASICKRVVAVEARPEASTILEENIKLNNFDDKILLFRCAVMPDSKPAFIALDDKDQGNPGASYISSTGQSVNSSTLEEILEGMKPEFIKMDVEGLEQTLLVANPQVVADAQVIIFEVSHAQSRRYGGSIKTLVHLLEDHGFVVTHASSPSSVVKDDFIDSMPDASYTNLIAARPNMVNVLQPTRDILAEEWRAYNPTRPADIDAFYRDSQHLKADIDEWHKVPSRAAWTDKIVEVCNAIKPQRVLDVGAGGGHDLIALRNCANPPAWVGAVEPNNLMQLHLEAQGIPYTDSIDDVTGHLDMVICIDVFEHISEPDRLIDSIARHMAIGSCLIEATATHDTSTPLHLPELKTWSPNRRLDRLGFVSQTKFGRLHVWRREKLVRGNEPTALFCAYRSLSTTTAVGLNDLVAAGWRYNIHSGDALIDRVRSIAVSNWLRRTDSDVFLMIDDDIGFDVQDANKIVKLARETQAIVVGAYPKHSGDSVAIKFLPGLQALSFGPGLDPFEIEFGSTGFMAVPRSVAQTVADTMPYCHEDEEWAFWPMFLPAILTYDDGRSLELSEDWAFCQRARSLGFKVILDPTIILTHYGQIGYTVYDIKQGVI